MIKITKEGWKKISKVIKSCKTKDQFDICCEWVDRINIPNEYNNLLVDLLLIKSRELK